MRNASRWLRAALGLVITITFLWLTFSRVSFNGISHLLLGVRWQWLTAALAAFGIDYIARIYRWWWMLRQSNPSVTFRACAGPLITGIAINNIMPLRAGDAFRVAGFRSHLNVSVGGLLGSLMIERLLDMTVLMSFFLAGVIGLTGTRYVRVYAPFAFSACCLSILAWGLLLFAGQWLELRVRALCHRPALVRYRWSASLQQSLEHLFRSLAVVKTPERSLKLLAMSLAAWCFEGCVYAAVANGLKYRGQPYGPWFALAAGSLSTLVPSSPGYIGTFEFFTVAGLHAYGTAPLVAAAIAVTVHSVLWLPITAVGIVYFQIFYLGRGGRRPVHDFSGEAREVP